jgi:hypothetical protein
MKFRHPTHDGAPGIWGSLCVYALVGRRCSLEVKLRKLGKLRRARSALGPCRNGRARASAVTNGHQRFGGTARLAWLSKSPSAWHFAVAI